MLKSVAVLKGFGLIALILAGEAAFLFHAALPAGIPASAPRATAAPPLVRAAPRDAAAPRQSAAMKPCAEQPGAARASGAPGGASI